MKISFSILKNKPVLNLDNNITGKVEDMLLRDDKVIGFKVRVKNSLKIPSCAYVPTEDIESINNQLMIVRSIHTSIDSLPFLRAQEIFLKEVIDENGFLIGIVIDIVFDSDNFKITEYQVSESIWSYIKNKKIILSPEEIILKENKILS
ncbi:PRC-barrel domain protein [Caldicellulosiruptor owensensis OL]|uniref:PRC-barrel domain protein n=1 Tax=Caldicellulosiruptor owensensis (strain ATCC 700167 / DSM 13100 / OL) TaxID=632518 RepID=E4Q1E8_CALOW|nr:PRC-barrel domain-containing protein [Caldicellulosiruptor owensensis]ADQ04682.1 PRC-barrel domain protein [Caldicellulosiruptor owensensis OL]